MGARRKIKITLVLVMTDLSRLPGSEERTTAIEASTHLRHWHIEAGQEVVAVHDQVDKGVDQDRVVDVAVIAYIQVDPVELFERTITEFEFMGQLSAHHSGTVFFGNSASGRDSQRFA